MPDTTNSADLSRMEQDWDSRAREAAEYYIATGQREWTREEFFEGGRINVENEILSDDEITGWGPPLHQLRVIEIGCGAGRMTHSMASVFREVHAVDISAEMIALAGKNLAHLPNVYLYKGSGADLPGIPDTTFDFAFSFIVFQHIPSLRVIESYVREVFRCLKPGGMFKFQVQGDVSIRSQQNDSWLGSAMSEADAQALAKRCGFRMTRSTGFGTQYAWLWFEKPGRVVPARSWLRKLKFWPERPVRVSFSTKEVRPGETYTVTISQFAGNRIDVAYELFGENNAPPATGVVSKWCELDSKGKARITVPADHPAALVRIARVRPRIRGSHWHDVSAEISVR